MPTSVQVHLVARIVLQDVITNHAIAEGKLAQQRTIAVVPLHVAVDIMHIAIADVDMADHPEVAPGYPNAAPVCRRRAGIGDFQILYFPIGLVRQIDRAPGLAIRGNARLGPAAIPAHPDGTSIGPRTLWAQLASPSRP
jgi:hypothetical protein